MGTTVRYRIDRATGRTIADGRRSLRRACPTVTAAAVLLATLGASSAVAHWAYVTNEKDNTITVIDTTTDEVVKTIAVGQRPRRLTLSRDYRFLYISASDNDSVQVMDIASDEIIHDLPSGEDPEQFVLHPDDRHLYIANEDDAIATMVDTASRAVVAQTEVGVEPEGMAVNHGGSYVIVTSETSNMAHRIDTSSHRIVANTLVDRATREVIDYLLVGRRVWHLALTPEEDKLYTTDGVSSDVTVIDVAALRPQNSVKVGRFPWGVAILPRDHIPES